MILHLDKEINRFKNVTKRLLGNKIFNFDEEDSLNYAFFHENGLFSKTEAIKEIIKKYKETRSSVKSKKPIVMLDIGCGRGEIDELIQHDFNGRIIGIDCSKEAIKMAIARKIDNARFLLSSAEKLCFLNESFDMVILVNVCHHAFKFIPFIIQESFSVLKENGLLVIFELNPFNPIQLFWFYFLSSIDRGATMINPTILKEIAELNKGKAVSAFKPLSRSLYFEYMAVYQKLK